MDGSARCIAVDVDASLTLAQHDVRGAVCGIDEVIPDDGQNSFAAGVFSTEGSTFQVRAARRVVPDEGATSAARRVRVHAAASRHVRKADDSPLYLMTSLPMQDYFTESSAASELVEQVQHSIEQSTTTGAESDQVLPACKVRVLPRTVAAFMDWAFSPSGDILTPPADVQKIVVVDVSHSGTTLAAFDAGTQELVPGSRVEVPSGWGAVLMSLGQALVARHALEDLPVRAAINALLNGQYHRRGSVWSCASLLSSAFVPLAELVTSAAASLVQVHELKAPTLLMSGPGAAALGEAVQPIWGDRILVPAQPEHCNARGMHKFGMLAMKGDL